MKQWTQDEFYAAKKRTDGRVELGTGDFTQVKFEGAHNIVIGTCSELGNDVHLGFNCEMGDHVNVGDRFFAGGALRIGEQCHFGTNADLGDCAHIGRGCCFAAGAFISTGTTIADDVELPYRCTLFGVPDANGKTQVKIANGNGAQLYAFQAIKQNATGVEVYVVTRQTKRRREEFEQWAHELAESQDSGLHILEGRKLAAAGAYIRARFALMGCCKEARK